MDPVTQATLGAAATIALLGNRSPLGRERLGTLAVMGALGGMAADLDVLIRSSDDPLLAIEYHRHFTHSLAFIPIGGVISGLPWLAFRRFRRDARWVLAASTVGYATHALLDACTTYGTLLLWPFSDLRVSWRVVSVIDPLFTIPLLVAVIAAAFKRRPMVAWLGLAWGVLYLAMGLVQRERAARVQELTAERRGHHIERGAVFPSFANQVTWRSLYLSDGRIYVDKIRVPWGEACVTPGTSVEHAPPPSEPLPGPAVRRGHRLMRWFADGWVGPAPSDPTVLGDLRYSFSPVEAAPIWGIRASDEVDRVEWVNARYDRKVTFGDFYQLIWEDGPDHVCF